MLTVDAHLHLWNLNRVHYHWLTSEDPLLYRNTLPNEVYPQMQAAGIDSALLVEAANSTSEIPLFVDMCEQNVWIAGFISWMSPEDQLTTEPHARHRGVRLPALQSNSELELPATVSRYHLTADLLLQPSLYPQALALIESHPETTFILDHFAGTSITPGAYRSWVQALRPLAECPNTVMKLAGYLTAAQPQPLLVDTLRAYVEEAVALFGTSRLMFGSDWPICTRAGTYVECVDILRQAMRHLAAKEVDMIMGVTAKRVYGLEV